MILQHFDDTTTLVISGIVMVFALMFHNVAQTWAAARLGDGRPKLSGFGAFDPQTQLEPIGVVLLFVLGFGWPKMVPISSRNYPGRGRKEALAWYAGPAAYLVVGFVSVVVATAFGAAGSLELYRAFLVAASYAVIHAVINLFPVFPLDGAMAALAWGNRSVRQLIQQVRQFGVLGFIVVFFVLSYSGVLSALQRFFLGLFVGIASIFV